MTVTITGKNVDINAALRSNVEDRMAEAVGKYFDGGFKGSVVFEKEGSGYRSDCTVHLDTGIVLQASGVGQETQFGFDQAADRIEKRLRRYKRKLKDHNNGNSAAREEAAAAYTVFATPEPEEELEADFAPVIVAETSTAIKTMTVGMAVMQLELVDAPVVMFRNAGSGNLNVVYRRPDGHVGWIDPALGAPQA
ncbi:MAG: ribosomal subunit interface protein [Hyphomicrobiales bacterium]|nr:MAG: ribosomal subunit interface protein [Hyphomicrobiales bacterium]